MDWKADVDSLI